MCFNFFESTKFGIFRLSQALSVSVLLIKKILLFWFLDLNPSKSDLREQPRNHFGFGRRLRTTIHLRKRLKTL